MNILIQLALLVIAASIVVFFSKEFGKGIKKIFSYPGAILLLPLAIASWLVVYFQKPISLFIHWMRIKTYELSRMLSGWIPGEQASLYIAKIVLLMLLSILPVIGINFYLTRKKYRKFDYMHFTGIMLWVFFAGVFISL